MKHLNLPIELPMGSVRLGHLVGFRRRGMMILVPCVECFKLRWIEMSKYQIGSGIRCRSCGVKRTVRNNKERSTGWFKDSSGYVRVRVDPTDKHFAMASKRRGYAAEHRLIMARHLGRDLVGTEIVHHLNCIRDDNRIENLQLTTSNEHASKYMRSYKDGYEAGYKAGLREGGNHQVPL